MKVALPSTENLFTKDLLQGSQGVSRDAGSNQTAEYFMTNFRMGKTLGVGSFGKVCDTLMFSHSLFLPALISPLKHRERKVMHSLSVDVMLQVKIAEHVLTGHKVAIKILHRKKIKAMDMEEKGEKQYIPHSV